MEDAIITFIEGNQGYMKVNGKRSKELVQLPDGIRGESVLNGYEHIGASRYWVKRDDTPVRASRLLKPCVEITIS